MQLERTHIHRIASPYCNAQHKVPNQWRRTYHQIKP